MSPKKPSGDVYHYTKLADITEPCERLCVYGVLCVIEKDLEPRGTGKYYGIVRVFDDTLSPGASFRVHLFFSDSVSGIEKGAILRFHRFKVERFEGILDGRIFKHSDLVVFPLLPNPQKQFSTSAKSIQYTSFDRRRVDELRKLAATMNFEDDSIYFSTSKGKIGLKVSEYQNKQSGKSPPKPITNGQSDNVAELKSSTNERVCVTMNGGTMDTTKSPSKRKIKQEAGQLEIFTKVKKEVDCSVHHQENYNMEKRLKASDLGLCDGCSGNESAEPRKMTRKQTTFSSVLVNPASLPPDARNPQHYKYLLELHSCNRADSNMLAETKETMATRVQHPQLKVTKLKSPDLSDDTKCGCKSPKSSQCLTPVSRQNGAHDDPSLHKCQNLSHVDGNCMEGNGIRNSPSIALRMEKPEITREHNNENNMTKIFPRRELSCVKEALNEKENANLTECSCDDSSSSSARRLNFQEGNQESQNGEGSADRSECFEGESKGSSPPHSLQKETEAKEVDEPAISHDRNHRGYSAALSPLRKRRGGRRRNLVMETAVVTLVSQVKNKGSETAFTKKLSGDGSNKKSKGPDPLSETIDEICTRSSPTASKPDISAADSSLSSADGLDGANGHIAADSSSSLNECPGIACLRSGCPASMPIILSDDDPRLANYDEYVFEELEIADVPSSDELNVQRSRLQTFMPFDENRPVCSATLKDLKEFTWPVFELKLRIVDIKPSLEVLRGKGPKDLLSGRCSLCCLFFPYSHLKWDRAKNTKRPICPNCVKSGTVEYVTIDFRITLLIKDAWGVMLTIMATKVEASNFIGVSLGTYIKSLQSREQVVQDLSDLLKSQRLLLIRFQKVTTQVNEQYQLYKTNLQHILRTASSLA